MGYLDLDCNEKKLYSDSYYSGDFDQNLYLVKAKDDGSHKDKYYIWATTKINGVEVKQGHLYFYLDHDTKTSSFIGVKVVDEFRNLNIGSLLISSWIDICLNSGYDFLGVHDKQRKPFLLYLLKTYGFDILDKSLYDTRKDVISVCRREDYDDKSKLLLFRDFKHEKAFLGTNIYKSDNYEIIHSLDNVIYLDDVIMPLQGMKKNQVPYWLLDYDKANVKVKSIFNKHKK